MQRLPLRFLGVLLVLAVGGAALVAASSPPSQPVATRPAHVFVIGFDNVHLKDVKRMPHLWSFLQRGVVSTNHHTVLNSHTAPGFVAMASGQYADKTGIYNNSMLRRDGSFVPGFAYWEPLVKPPSLLTPPPWRVFTQAGLPVGAVGFGDMVLENEGEAGALLGHPTSAMAATEYQGLAVHGPDGSSQLGNRQIKYLRGLRYQFTGWVNMRARYSLDVTLAMVDHGVPVIYTYIENQRGSALAGTYDAVIAQDDAAFLKFFEALNQRGITPTNSLFVVTTDEGDYYNLAGAPAVNLPQRLRELGVDTTRLRTIGGAMALVQQPAADIPRTTEALARVEGWEAIAAGAGLDAIHLRVRQDPDRTPAFILYGRPDSGYLTQTPTGVFLRWNHGTLDPKITTTWLALVGPGIRRGELTAWSDHTDLLPTIAHVMRLSTDPQWDGRVLYEALAAPPPFDRELAGLYKQLNAPNGAFGREALRISTQAALRATRPQGRQAQDFLAESVAERDRLVAAIAPRLRAAVSDPGLLRQANDLLERMRGFGR